MDTFTVSVGDVPPTLTLSPACPGASPCDARTVTLGSATTLTGAITHAGSADAETVSINWGDGSAADSNAIGTGIIFLNANPTLTAASSTSVPFSGTHTCARPGSYPITVTTSDQAGGTATASTTEVARGTQTITFEAIPGHTFGDAPFTISATGGASASR